MMTTFSRAAKSHQSVSFVFFFILQSATFLHIAQLIHKLEIHSD